MKCNVNNSMAKAYGEDFNLSTEEIINTIEDAYSTELCIGTDSEGNTYLSGYYGVYVLNQDMKPVMWIEHAKDVDIENRKVYLNWINSNYEAPLYSLEDLLEIAEVYQG